jgi:hypothetical protein
VTGENIAEDSPNSLYISEDRDSFVVNGCYERRYFLFLEWAMWSLNKLQNYVVGISESRKI